MDEIMIHATITPHGKHCAVTMTSYDLAHKEAVKALAGAEYIDGAWIVSVLHLPTLKGIFGSLTVVPEVVAAYHEALRSMLDQLLPSAHRKGALGQHIAELMALHANGIAAIKAKGYTPPIHRHVEATPVAKTQPAAVTVADAGDPALTVWLAGAQNAAKAAERKAEIVKARRRKKKEAV